MKTSSFKPAHLAGSDNRLKPRVGVVIKPFPESVKQGESVIPKFIFPPIWPRKALVRGMSIVRPANLGPDPPWAVTSSGFKPQLTLLNQGYSVQLLGKGYNLFPSSHCRHHLHLLFRSQARRDSPQVLTRPRVEGGFPQSCIRRILFWKGHMLKLVLPAFLRLNWSIKNDHFMLNGCGIWTSMCWPRQYLKLHYTAEDHNSSWATDLSNSLLPSNISEATR